MRGLGGYVCVHFVVVTRLHWLSLISNLLVGVKLLVTKPGIHVYHIVVILRLVVQVKRDKICVCVLEALGLGV